MRPFALFRLLALLALLVAQPAAARPLAVDEVPEPLRPWTGWVLFPHADRDCPVRYSEPVRECLWPSALTLALDGRGGTFEQRWRVDRAGWVPLPGDGKRWPAEVTVDGEPALPLAREGAPAVELQPGEHRVAGAFRWARLPERLALPAATGLVSLSVDGQARPEPVIDAEGRLWLGEREGAARERAPEDSLRLEVFRRIVDDLPLQVRTLLELEVSGAPREILLPAPLPAGAIPLELSAPLPARLEEDGRLRLQVRPGRWRVELTARFPGPVESLALEARPGPWPAEEIWAFEARPALRLVEPGGLPQVDPRQTRLPDDWQNLPAFRARPGESLTLREVRRGDPDPEPDNLRLQRRLWLDFDGGGYTFSDTITGTMTRGWRLEADPEVSLGRVTLNGQPRFITTLPGGERRGVEVRRGEIRLNADSRYTASRGDLPAGGWGRAFQQVGATLNLPPGWRLLAVGGVDNVPASWVQRWTLLDLFVVLIAAVAVARLWGWGWGALALATLALLWHEPGAPRWVWLYLLASVALLRVLPPGRFRRFAQALRTLGLLALLVIGLPFLADQAVNGLYPQLERPWQGVPSPVLMEERGAGLVAPSAPSAAMEQSLDALQGKVLARKAERPAAAVQTLDEVDPAAVIQTGPGLPEWQWREVSLGWNGPVPADQRIRLVLLPPPVNLLLNLLRIALAGLLGWRLALWARTGLGRPRLRGGGALLLLPLALAAALGVTPDAARAEAFPPQPLLDTLEQRLTAPPECLPACADIDHMGLTVDGDALDARLTVQAAVATAIPLPLDVRHATPVAVLLDDAPADLARTPDGALWARLPAGRHELLLRARLPAGRQVQLPLPLPPHRVTVTARGWQVEGVDEDGAPERQLVLTRLREAQAPAAGQALQPTALPPFVRVERTLRLGLQWSVETRVVRLSPAGAPVVLRIPLLPGESVVTEGLTVRDGHALVNLAPMERIAGWSSRLEKGDRLTLTAPETSEWVERWQADIGPTWHAELGGIPVIHHQDQSRRWLPEWRPWPGESATLAVTRPEGVAGQTLTIDRSEITVTPGKRATDAVLDLRLRSSQGGRHEVRLPPGAELQSVAVDGRTQPIRQEGGTVALPVVPGEQRYRLAWRQPEGVENLWRTPAVGLGIPSTNASIEARLGQDRWVLYTGGPSLGPAVLFWGVLLIVVLAAAALGRTRPLTPLGTLSWLLLGVGLSQGGVWSALVVAGWLFALGLRGRMPAGTSKWRHDLAQIGLVLLTVAALAALFGVVQKGLLGLPEMQVAGNQSSAHDLRWYQDLAGAELPRATVVSAPLLVYRLLMLAWALWLAFALVGWLRWGWGAFTSNGLWRRLRRER